MVEYPTVTYGVPGFDPTSGPGYRTLRNGEVVFVRTPRTTESSLPSTSKQVVPAAPAVVIEGGLTKPGPPVRGWSWKVNKHKTPSERLVTPLVSTDPTLLSNSFASLSVSTELEREAVQATNKAYNALTYSSDPCPIELEGLRKDYVRANAALNAACDACNPFPSVDPPFKDYYVDPFEEEVMDPLDDDVMDSVEEEDMDIEDSDDEL